MFSVQRSLVQASVIQGSVCLFPGIHALLSASFVFIMPCVTATGRFMGELERQKGSAATMVYSLNNLFMLWFRMLKEKLFKVC